MFGVTKLKEDNINREMGNANALALGRHQSIKRRHNNQLGVDFHCIQDVGEEVRQG